MKLGPKLLQLVPTPCKSLASGEGIKVSRRRQSLDRHDRLGDKSQRDRRYTDASRLSEKAALLRPHREIQLHPLADAGVSRSPLRANGLPLGAGL